MSLAGVENVLLENKRMPAIIKSWQKQKEMSQA
jgi:hypothetical protein